MSCKSMRRYAHRRDRNGIFFYLAFLGLIPLSVAIGALSIDFMHFNSVQAELQRACDAGALAGAQQLWRYNSNPNAAINAATTIAGWNEIDGQPLNTVSNATITATIETAPSYNSSPPSLGTVRCSAKYNYKSIWAYMFGAGSQNCCTSALAGASSVGNETLAGGLMPAAVSIDIPDQTSGKALYQSTIGSTISFQWHHNIEWTGFSGIPSASTVSAAEAAYNNLQPGSPNTASPVVDVNSIINVSNGIQDSNVSTLTSYIGDVLVFPVVADSGSLGPGSYTVVGFVGLELKSVNSGSTPTITGVLVPPLTSSDNNLNAPAVGSSSNYAWNSFLQSSKPISAHLLK